MLLQELLIPVDNGYFCTKTVMCFGTLLFIDAVALSRGQIL